MWDSGYISLLCCFEAGKILFMCAHLFMALLLPAGTTYKLLLCSSARLWSCCAYASCTGPPFGSILALPTWSNGVALLAVF
jgi:hypothetical protein